MLRYTGHQLSIFSTLRYGTNGQLDSQLSACERLDHMVELKAHCYLCRAEVNKHSKDHAASATYILWTGFSRMSTLYSVPGLMRKDLGLSEEAIEVILKIEGETK